MKLVLLFGDAAVGKMTVGQELTKITDLRLFHNHKDVRLSRNVSENRLNNKPSKMDIEWSNKRLIEDDRNHRLVSFDGEISFNNYIKLTIQTFLQRKLLN